MTPSPSIFLWKHWLSRITKRVDSWPKTTHGSSAVERHRPEGDWNCRRAANSQRRARQDSPSRFETSQHPGTKSIYLTLQSSARLFPQQCNDGLKLADFGLAVKDDLSGLFAKTTLLNKYYFRAVNKNALAFCAGQTICGRANYSAPEMDKGLYNEKVLLIFLNTYNRLLLTFRAFVVRSTSIPSVSYFGKCGIARYVLSRPHRPVALV